ncbi:SCP-like protein [Oesophagostomum dentatum]|uniref:SCP-like protein n=1 Tax=Oesophagostomum dentatum TaxID=61180 RepID=A0A0B1SAD5_OESDE|nr:SCP-like protein [Oesophagostomum dentatum]
MHNNFRGSVARGQTEVSAGWGIAPPAALMYRMKYDCDAESHAQQAVSTCRTTPLPSHALGHHKQNLHVLRTVHTTPEGAIQNAVVTWWSELARFGMRSNMMFYPSERTRGHRSVENWSKMAWWSNMRIGCAIQHCGLYYVTSCMYHPGGNYDYAYVYRVGAVCSDCPSGSCDYQALCRW